MSHYHIDYKPNSYRRHVDDTFLLFPSELHVAEILNYMHRNIMILPSSVKFKESLHLVMF